MKRGTVGLILLGVVGAGIAAFVGASEYIERRVISEAAARGVTLSIAHVRWLSDGIHFESVVATTAQIPRARIGISDLSIDWSFSQVVVNGGEVTLDGPVTPPNPAAKDNPVPATSGPTSVHVRSAHISWTHVMGDASVDLADVSGDFALAPQVGDSFSITANASATALGKKLGPFTTDVSRDTAGDHVRVTLDPADPTGDIFAVDHDATRGFTRYEWTASQRPLSKLGIHPDFFGLTVAGDPLVQIHVVDSITRPEDGPAQGNGLLALSTGPIQLPGLPDPVTSSLDVSWAGNPDQPTPVKDGALTVGPFAGPITGTITRPFGAIAVNLAVASNAVPCSKFQNANPAASLLGGSAMGALAAMAGVKSDVIGDVKIDGTLQFDSRNPGARRISLTPTTTCGLSISLGSGGK